MAEPLVLVPSIKASRADVEPSVRTVPEETPVALVYDGSTHAVMMATPADLEDFAVGFSLSEGKIEDASEIDDLSVVEHGGGIELRMWLKPGAAQRNAVCRRAMLGPTGCGLCGIDSLEAALPELPLVEAAGRITVSDVFSAIDSVRPAQVLNAQAHAVHAAGFWRRGAGLVRLREDVGRHNALDKLAGSLRREGLAADDGIVVLTSRVSVEMVQKAVRLGAPVIAAVSAPTALAIRTAEAAGVTLVAIARGDTFEIFTHAHRILPAPLSEGRFRQEISRHAAC